MVPFTSSSSTSSVVGRKKDIGASPNAQEKVPASSNTQESRFPSTTSPMTSLIMFHPGLAVPCAVNLVVKPSASMVEYALVESLNLLLTKYCAFCFSFTSIGTVATPPFSSGTRAMFWPLRRNPRISGKKTQTE
ncbi:hypothetical protein ACHAXM_000511 [Skeletonema potamos]